MKASLATRGDVGGFHLVEWLQVFLVDCHVIWMGYIDNPGQGNFRAVTLTLSYINCHKKAVALFIPRIPQEHQTLFSKCLKCKIHKHFRTATFAQSILEPIFFGVLS